MEMSKSISEAIQYVRENKTWSEAEERVALDRINELRCDVSYASEKISDDIHDLMEEYGEENNLPEGWWLDETTEDDIFFSL